MTEEKIKEEVNKSVDKFAEAMKEVLLNPKNIKKGTSWKTCEIEYLRTKLSEEYDEWDLGKFSTREQEPKELIDTASLCMMLWDRLKERE